MGLFSITSVIEICLRFVIYIMMVSVGIMKVIVLSFIATDCWTLS
jgi:hypothetical protein